MTDQQAKETYFSRILLDSKNREFICDDRVKETYGKGYNYKDSDVRRLQFTNDALGMTSDCYILYAIAHLGCATKDTMVSFLTALANKYPDLHIVYGKDNINERLRFMYGLGLVQKIFYDVYLGPNNKKERITLYITTEDGVGYVKQHLKKRCTYNNAFYTKHIIDLIGWGCAAYIGSTLAERHPGFVEFSEGVLRTKQMGSMFFPCEWKAKVADTMFYVAFQPSYLEFDKSYMTNIDYADCCLNIVDTIRNYINCRTKKGIPCVVVVVEDNKDLNHIALNIMASGNMNGMLSNIFFTGEGAILGHKGNEKNAFYQIMLDPDVKEGYSIVSCKAPFMP